MSPARAWAVVLGLLVSVTLAAQTPPPAKSQHGRLFPPQDLGLLEAPDRDEWQRPQQILDALGVAEASVVADVGAGSGWFTVRLARRVGPNGLVYAQDVQPEMLAAITRRVQREGLGNVRPLLGSRSDPHLPAMALDSVLVVGVVHEIEDRVAWFRNLGRSLKASGRLGVVDFRPGDSGPGPSASERVDAGDIERDAARAGLTLLWEETFLPFQYCLIFGRSDASELATPPSGRRAPAPKTAAPRPRPRS